MGEAISAFFEAIAPVLEWIGYAVLAVLVLFLLHRLWKYLSDGESDFVDEPVTTAISARSSNDWLPSEDPDALAQAGDFERAIAVLLLLALRKFGWGARPEDRSRTAREVLAEVPPSDSRRTGLRALVDDVEPLRFGGVIADAGAYHRARSLFHALGEAR
ncbi:MAG: DUF4129 domain-containing protein [Myxococcota bacterium]